MTGHLLTTTPGVVYKVYLNNGDTINLHNPSSLPDLQLVFILQQEKNLHCDV